MYRFRDSLRRNDKGSVLLEAVISLGIISLLTLGYTAAATSATVTQRTAINDSIATQVSQGIFETARATPWSKIGTTTKPETGLLPDASGEIFEAADELPATSTKTIRGLDVTVKTAVGWKDQPGTGSDFGTKLIVVDVSWRDNAADPGSQHSRRESTIITPGIGEAAPSGVRAGDEKAVENPPAVPVLSGSVIEGPKVKAVWNHVEGATGYSLQTRVNGGSWGTETMFHPSTTVNRDVAYGDTFEMRVRAESPAGPSYYSNMVTIVVPAELAAPVIESANLVFGTIMLNWTEVPGATSYTLEKRLDGGAWVLVGTTPITFATFAGTPGTTTDIRVRANKLSASGPYSASLTMVLEALAPAPVVALKALTSTTAQASWTMSPGVYAHSIDRQINGGPWEAHITETLGTSETLTAPAGSTVRVRVYAHTNAGRSLPGEAAVVLAGIPAAPVVTGKLEPATESVGFTWPAVADAASYRIEYKYGTAAWTLLHNALTTTTSATVPAKGNALVTVRVRADNANASSAWSRESPVTAPTTPIGWKYESYGGAAVLGKPTESEVASLRDGRYRRYEKGTIHWTPAHGAAVNLNGPIRDRYQMYLGGNGGQLGYAIADQVPGPRGGYAQAFEGGALYVRGPGQPAWESWGSIRSKWGGLGFENGHLGYPISSEYTVHGGGIGQKFENGNIYFTPRGGTYVVLGGMLTNWDAGGGTKGPMGYPTSDEYWWGSLIRQNFEGGYFTWNPSNGAVARYSW